MAKKARRRFLLCLSSLLIVSVLPLIGVPSHSLGQVNKQQQSTPKSQPAPTPKPVNPVVVKPAPKPTPAPSVATPAPKLAPQLPTQTAKPTPAPKLVNPVIVKPAPKSIPPQPVAKQQQPTPKIQPALTSSAPATPKPKPNPQSPTQTVKPTPAPKSTPALSVAIPASAQKPPVTVTKPASKPSPSSPTVAKSKKPPASAQKPPVTVTKPASKPLPSSPTVAKSKKPPAPAQKPPVTVTKPALKPSPPTVAKPITPPTSKPTLQPPTQITKPKLAPKPTPAPSVATPTPKLTPQPPTQTVKPTPAPKSLVLIQQQPIPKSQPTPAPKSVNPVIAQPAPKPAPSVGTVTPKPIPQLPTPLPKPTPSVAKKPGQQYVGATQGTAPLISGMTDLTGTTGTTPHALTPKPLGTEPKTPQIAKISTTVQGATPVSGQMPLSLAQGGLPVLGGLRNITGTAGTTSATPIAKPYVNVQVENPESSSRDYKTLIKKEFDEANMLGNKLGLRPLPSRLLNDIGQNKTVDQGTLEALRKYREQASEKLYENQENKGVTSGNIAVGGILNLKTLTKDLQGKELVGSYRSSDYLAKALESPDMHFEAAKWSRDWTPTSNSPDYQLAVASVRKKIEDAYRQGKPINIVAHSEGANIAYDAIQQLAKEKPEVKINNFVTIGTRLEKVASPETLPSVKQWTNFYNPDDPLSTRSPGSFTSPGVLSAVLSGPDFSQRISEAHSGYYNDPQSRSKILDVLKGENIPRTPSRLQDI